MKRIHMITSAGVHQLKHSTGGVAEGSTEALYFSSQTFKEKLKLILKVVRMSVLIISKRR